MPNRSTIAALVLAALWLSACGSSSSSQSSSQSKSSGSAPPSLSAFKTGYAHDKAEFTKVGNDLAAAIDRAPRQSNGQLKSEFRALASATARSQAALGKLNPPARYKAKLDALVAGFGPVVKDMKAIAAASASGNATAARNAATSLVRHSATLKTADDALTGALGLPQTK